MKKALLRITAFLLILLCLPLASCAGKSEKAGTVRLSFADSLNMNRIKELSGQTVEIVGYMATLSSVSGTYLYLMNLPYQSCPFCVPNTQQLSNTIAVYAKEGKKFKFYDGSINVTGPLEVGNFSDEYGYTYNYRITNAVYSPVNSTEASEKLALWERITDAKIAADTYSMFDYVYFECNWINYTGKDEAGNTFYLYPADVPRVEEKKFPTESADDFFPNLIKRAEAIGDDRMKDLIKILTDGQSLAKKAIAERTAGNYTYDSKKDQYTLKSGDSLLNEAQALYTRYAVWLEIFSLSK